MISRKSPTLCASSIPVLEDSLSLVKIYWVPTRSHFCQQGRVSRLCSLPALAASEDDGDYDHEDEEALYEDEAVEGADIDSEEAYKLL